MKTNKIAKKIGLFFFSSHCIIFTLFVLNINTSHDPQAPLLWVFFSIIDFPISLLYFSGKLYSNFLNELGVKSLLEVLYLPYVIHGLLGAIWWYFLPRLVTTKKFGGVWGNNL